MNKSEMLARMGYKHREKVAGNVPLVPLSKGEFGLRIIKHKIIKASESSESAKGFPRWYTARFDVIPYQELVR